LADTYGKSDLVKSGPLFTEAKVMQNGIALRFDHTGTGLTTRDGKPPTWFEIAGSDHVYHPADAKISADAKTILLSSPAVPQPKNARFAWSQLAEPNLSNREGLPAAAFHTDWAADPASVKPPAPAAK
jgi:sialate O-acetylesterase